MIRALNIIALILAFVLAGALYVAKDDAKHAQARLQSLQTQIAQTRETVRQLENEQAALENPERLARLAQEHLGMVPVSDAALRSADEAAKELKAIAEHEEAKHAEDHPRQPARGEVP